MSIVAALTVIFSEVTPVHRALVLFDIDGTLVRRAGPHHRAALVHGIRRVTGLETTTEGIPVQGMLDPVILTVMLRTAGVSRKEIARRHAGDPQEGGALLSAGMPGHHR